MTHTIKGSLKIEPAGNSMLGTAKVYGKNL